MELSDLRLFRAVAEAGGVTRAAHRLHRVQSNVTARVKRLESTLGVSLFVRGRRGMSPTPEGRRLLDYTERLLALAEEARADLSAHPPRGRLLIGAMESTAAVHLPRLLSTLHAKYPALDVHLVTATSGVLMAQVRAGELSAAFVAGDVAEPGLVALVTFGAGCTYRACIQDWLATRGLRPHRVFEVGSYHAMLACVAANVGYALAPRSVLLASVARATVRAHRLRPRPWRVTTHLVRRAGDRSRAVEALRALVVARQR
ncbi:MAG: LysR family transcriptional regulator [Candidatus Rokuibacteriota bacterium]|nr:MAG: LysR family transcriptional regulator [Candidatus Rokubacteria bacterium]